MSKIVSLNLMIPSLAREKDVYVYVPDSPDLENDTFPVIYMQDGHNLFFPETSYSGVTWEIEKHLNDYENQFHRSFIVVGIACPSIRRMDEYSPFSSDFPVGLLGEERERLAMGGEGDAYLEWMMEDLKPTIDHMFPTNSEETYVAGSSMGAYISLYAAFKYPDIIKKVGCFSPAFWFNESEMVKYVSKHDGNPDLFVYMDMGTNETSNDSIPDFPHIYLEGARNMNRLLEDKEIRHVYIEAFGAIHSESEWAKRFPTFLQILSE